MSSHKDNRNNKKLKDLLNNPENEPMDDFEKEALEGFSTLKGEDEIFELKAGLDKRMDARFFTKEEKKQDKVYWYAAAGLILLVGFSIYFIQSNLSPKEDNLAVTNEAAVAAELIQQSIAADTAQFKEAEAPLAKPAAPVVDDAKKTIPPEKDIKTEKAARDVSVAANYSFGKAMQPSASVESAPMAAPPAALPEKNISRDEDFAVQEAESDKMQREEISVSPAKKDFDKSGESKKRKKEEREQESAGDFVRSSSAPAANPEAVNAYYEGGAGALNASLRTKLEAKNLLQSFNATVFINEKKKIQKVVLSNTGELTKEQQKDIIGAIKSLDKFNFSNPAEGKFVAEYKVIFRP